MASAVSTLKLTVDDREYGASIKEAKRGMLDLEESLKLAGKSFKDCEAKVSEYVRNIGNMETSNKTAKGSISEMSIAFVELSKQYRSMSDEMKKSDVGKGLSASLDQLKQRIINAKGELQGINQELSGSKFGELGGMLDDIGHKMGVNANITELLTSKTALMTGAIGAATTAIVASTKAWAAYNAELAKMDNATMVVTGLKGTDANEMTDAAKSLATVYNVDFRQAIEAANTLMSQFGESGDSAMKILRDGMQGMIQGDGGKLLSMIQQYAPAFHDAGVSASQLVAVIQNSEGGIFTDQNMNAIVMGIKNIRLMTKQTSEALAKMCIDGEEMSRKMSDGSMTVFDALKQVAGQLKNAESGSKTAGEVMQTVFGRQGAMAGTNLAKAIESLNTNLEETKKQTGEIGQATADLQAATERLNKAIRDCFEYDGWDVMKTEIQTGLIVALAEVVKTLGDIKTAITDFEVAGLNIFDTLRESAVGSLGPLGALLNTLIDINKEVAEYKALASGAQHGSALEKALLGGADSGSTGNTPSPTTDTKAPPTITGGIKGVKEMAGIGVDATESMSDLQAQLSAYKKAMANANNVADYKIAQQGIEDIQQKIDMQPLAIQLGIDTDTMTEISDQMTEFGEELRDKLPPIEIKATGVATLRKQTEEMAKEWQSAGSAIQAVGSAMQAIEDPAAKVLGTIAQAIATMALSYSQASLQAAKNPANAGWGWIAFAATGVATMLSSIAAIKSATAGSYAEGGIVPGNNYNDGLIAHVSSGELILNRAQQNTLAAQLTGGNQQAQGGASSTPYVSGEQIFLGLKNYLRRTGRGELVTAH